MRICVYNARMSTTAARRRFVRNLVGSKDVRSQSQIVAALSKAGYDVTQATVSRDLQVIGAGKVDGESYRLTDRPDPEEARGGLARSIDEFVESIAASGPLVVLKTPPGAAQVVAAAIDRAGLDGVIGTVAGDDTILVIAGESILGRTVANTLEEIGSTA